MVLRGGERVALSSQYLLGVLFPNVILIPWGQGEASIGFE